MKIVMRISNWKTIYIKIELKKIAVSQESQHSSKELKIHLKDWLELRFCACGCSIIHCQLS